MNYERTRTIFNKTFENDYSFVGHPELAPVGPFDQVEQRYNLTRLPGSVDWYKGMENVEKLMVNCMDHHVSPNIWRRENRAVITIAGGIVQHGVREEVLQEFCGLLAEDYMAGRYPNLIKASWGSHNNSCGHLGVELGQKLPALLACPSRSPEETAYMKRLIANGSNNILQPLKAIDGLILNIGVFDTQRQPSEPAPAFIKFNPNEVIPLSISDLRAFSQ